VRARLLADDPEPGGPQHVERRRVGGEVGRVLAVTQARRTPVGDRGERRGDGVGDVVQHREQGAVDIGDRRREVPHSP
jgi:hypothetical protein